MKPIIDCIAGMEEGMDRVAQALPGFPHADVALYKLLTVIGGAIAADLANSLKSSQLNPSDFDALMQLFASPEGFLSAGELAGVTGQSATNMTRITNALVKRGLITRAAGVADRRQIVLKITASGRRFVTKLLPPLFPRLERAFVGLTKPEKKNMERMLRKVAQNIDNLTRTDDAS
jgi:MarR family transcriptional repressor of emrRAB